MVYSATSPQPTDLLSNSQPQLLENFSKLNSIFDANHVTFNAVTAANRGKHTYVTMLENGGIPVTVAGEGAIHVDVSGGTREYAYYNRESAGPTIPFSMLGGFASFTNTGAVAGTAFNLTAVRTALGKYTVSFTNVMIDGDYAVLVTPTLNLDSTIYSAITSTKTASSFKINIKDFNNTFNDPNSFSVLVFGEIA